MVTKRLPNALAGMLVALIPDANPRNIVVGGAPGTHLDLAWSVIKSSWVGTAVVDLTQPRVHCIHPASYLNIQKGKWRTEQKQH